MAMKKVTTYLMGILIFGIAATQPVLPQERELPLAEQVQIYPNPTDGKFQVTLKVEGTEKVTAKVYDLTGKLIEDITKELVRDESSISAQVDLNHPPSGIYFLRVQVGLKLMTKKIIIR